MGFKSAYSPKRSAAIAKAINDWMGTVQKPRVANAEAIIHADYNHILRWASAVYAPAPENMQRFWEATGNRVFLLTQEERVVFSRRNFTMPSLEELPLGKEEDTPELTTDATKRPKREKAGKYISAYCEERKREISVAVKDWCQALPGSGRKSEKAGDALQVAPGTVCNWISGKFSPGPLYMHQLWVITGKPVFLLRQEEKEVFLARRQEIPKDYPLYEEYAERHGLTVKKPPEKRAVDLTGQRTVEPEKTIEAFENVPDKQVIVNAIIGLNIACSIACDLFGKYKDVVLPENQRRRVAEIIRRLFTSLGLSEKDFLPKQQLEETDPAAKKRMERLFTTLAEPQA